jgi:hypothetical protein
MLAKAAKKDLTKSKPKSKPKSLQEKARVLSSGSVVTFKAGAKPKVKDSAPEAEEKPHKSSLAKAKRKAGKLKETLPAVRAMENEVAELMPNVSSQEARHLEEYLSMFESLHALIIKAEKVCLDEDSNSKEYYALCALMSQQREIIADIRSVTDMSGQVATMETSVIKPLVSNVGQNILDSMFQIRRIIIDCASKDKVQAALHLLEGVTKEQGTFLHAQYSQASDKVGQILLG